MESSGFVSQAVGVESKKKFRIGEQADPLALFAWLLNVLHRDQRDRKTGSGFELQQQKLQEGCVPTYRGIGMHISCGLRRASWMPVFVCVRHRLHHS